jgi:hypothetical protein
VANDSVRRLGVRLFLVDPGFLLPDRHAAMTALIGGSGRRLPLMNAEAASGHAGKEVRDLLIGHVRCGYFTLPPRVNGPPSGSPVTPVRYVWSAGPVPGRQPSW